MKRVPLDEAERRKQQSGGLTTVTAAELQLITFPPVSYVISGYIAEGLTLLCGKPKLGKSWMALDWTLAVACGGAAMGSIPCEGGNVLYAAMEDNQRRLQRRIEQLLPDERDWPSQLDLTTIMRRLDEGGIDDLQAWAERVETPKLIVLDTLACVRSTRTSRDTGYESDYAAVGPLQSLAGEMGIAIVVVHHLRKLDADDPLDTVSGTTGLTGAADSILVLTRDSQGCALYGRGRDIDEIETAMQFDKTTGQWTVLGPASEVRRSDERQAILDILASSDDPMRPNEIAGELGQKVTNVQRLLSKMAKDGDVTKVTYGKYILTPGQSGLTGQSS